MVVSNTTSNLLFTSHSSAHSAFHMQLAKLFSFNLVCPKIISCEYFFDEILLDEKKANYSTYTTYSSFLWYMFCQLSRLSIHNHHLVLSRGKRRYTNTSCLGARSVHLTIAYSVAIMSQIQPPTSATLILQEMRNQ